ncbi:type II toxin-antitoxin system HicB family antitoxin [Leptodesmis sp.]
MSSLKSYTVVLCPDDHVAFGAYIPAIAGCHAWGKTMEEAPDQSHSLFS